MIDKNKSVWSKFGGSLRFGNVKEEKIEKGWKFLKINWMDDEAYEASISWKSKMRGGRDFTKTWYRIDEVKVFTPAKMIGTLKKL